MKENKLKNYIIFWLSQLVSQLGSSITSFALIIWAYKETNSAMAVSLMTFAYYLPYIFVSAFAGAFIDKYDKKMIILISDLISAICSIVVLVLVILNKLEIGYIYIINGIVGFMSSFQSPASSVVVGIMVQKEKYKKVSGMNSFSNSLLTVITPMLSAFIISFSGLKGIIVIDLITFLVAFFILLFYVEIEENILKKTIKEDNIFEGIKEGFKFLKENKGILNIIVSIACMNFLSRITYENILSPMILARSCGNDKVLGIVSGVLGFGGIIGGLIVSFKKLKIDNLKLIYYSAAFSFLLGDLLMALGNNVFIWSLAAISASLPIPFIGAGQNVIMYNSIPKEMQGRIFAVRNSIQFCTIPIGILLGGFLADYVFEPFMLSENKVAVFFQSTLGKQTGSGMALMFAITSVLGFITCISWYKNREIKKLKDIK